MIKTGRNTGNSRVWLEADTEGLSKDQRKGHALAALAELRRRNEAEIREQGRRETQATEQRGQNGAGTDYAESRRSSSNAQMVTRFYPKGEQSPEYWNFFAYWEGDHYATSWQWIYDDGDRYDDMDTWGCDWQTEADVLREMFYTRIEADEKAGDFPTWQDMACIWVED